MPRWTGWLLTFTPVVFAWVFFRATSFSRAWEILHGMFGINGAVLPPHYMPLALGKHFLSFLGVDFSYPPFWALVGGKKEILALFFCFFIVLALSNSYEWCRGHLQKTHFSLRWAMAIGGILALSICFLSRISEFLYFQF
jgi:alginate O-acetyltransferase complex protein AlgI